MKYLLQIINKGMSKEIHDLKFENMYLKARVKDSKPTIDRLRKERNFYRDLSELLINFHGYY